MENKVIFIVLKSFDNPQESSLLLLLSFMKYFLPQKSR